MISPRMQKARRGLLAATAVAAVLLTTACGSGTGTAQPDSSSEATPASARKAENRLVVSSQQDPGTLDYVVNNQTALILWIPGNVVEPLVFFTEDGEAQPGVAESWTVSEDQLSYTFTIRDAEFSNGEPVTASDVVYSLTEMRNSPISTYSAPYGAVSSIEETSENTVTVQLSRPSQSFFRGMGSMSALIQPEASAASRATAPIGTGPYVLDSYVTDSGYEFSKNPNYWGTAPSIDAIDVKIIPDGASALNALAAGEIDVMPVITIDLWERLSTQGLDKAFDLVTYPQVGEMLYAAFNSTQAPYDDPAVRQALAQSFDREAYIAAFNAPFGAEATCGYGLENTSWYEAASDSSCPYPADTEAATAAIADAGLTGESLELTSLSDVADLSLPADIMAAQLTEAGVKLDRNAIELARYSQTVFQARPPQFGITVMSDPAPITQFLCADPADMGWTSYCSPEFTKLVTDADAAPSVEEYDALMKQANELLVEDAVIVPLLAKSGVGLFHPELGGWQQPQVMVELQFKNLHW